MELKTVDINTIIPYANNPRINAKAVDAVAESIKQCGYIAPIIVDENMVILAGHTRRLALLKLKRKDCQIAVVSGLTEEQKKKYRLLDNKTNELAEWDLDKLAEELDGLDFEGFDFGFATNADKKVHEDDYDKPVPEEPRSKLGDLYKCGRHRLLVGDSTKAEDVHRLCGNVKVDMLLTDPPYNVNVEETAGKILNDNMGDAEFRLFLTNAFANASSVMKPGAAFHIWHSDSERYNFQGACIDAGLRVRQCLIWVKDQLVLGRQDFQWKHEPALYGEKTPEFGTTVEYEDEEHMPCLYGWKDGTHYWFKNRKQTTILQFERPKASREHPTMKPVLLFDYEMKCNTRNNEVVLDLFGGSGTTMIAAEQNGRTAYLMEFDPKYADVIVDRWETLTGEKAELIRE